MTTPNARRGGAEPTSMDRLRGSDLANLAALEAKGSGPVQKASRTIAEALAQARAEERERTLDEVLGIIAARIDGWGSGGRAYGVDTRVIHSRGEAHAIHESIAALRSG